MSQYPKELLTLIAYLKKLPGVGRKTAERFAFYLMEWHTDEIKKFSSQLSTIQEKIKPCEQCGCFKEGEACSFCSSPSRDQTLLCLVSSPRDVYAIEETKAFKGLYHVLGGLLSPLEGRHLDKALLERLELRLSSSVVEEVIIALDSTLEGDATSLYVKQKLESWGKATTRLAFGLPMGSSLDFVDYGTLEKAFTGRQRF